MKRNRKTNLDESRIQTAIVKFLRSVGFDGIRGLVFSVPNESIGIRWGARMKRQGRLAGVSDLEILMPGARTVFVEVKDATKDQRQNQIEFEILVRGMGFEYLLWRSLDDAMAWESKQAP